MLDGGKCGDAGDTSPGSSKQMEEKPGHLLSQEMTPPSACLHSKRGAALSVTVVPRLWLP